MDRPFRRCVSDAFDDDSRASLTYRRPSQKPQNTHSLHQLSVFEDHGESSELPCIRQDRPTHQMIGFPRVVG